MKKRAIASLVVLFGLGFIVSTFSYKNAYSVDRMASKVVYNDVLIKNSNLDVLYNGKSDFVPKWLKNKQVVEIATCEDSENTITLFIK